MNPRIGNGFEQYLIPMIGDVVMFSCLETNEEYEDKYIVRNLMLFDDDKDLIVTLEAEDGTTFDCYARELIVEM